MRIDNISFRLPIRLAMAAAWLWMTASFVFVAAQTSDEFSLEEAREQEIVERFQTVLERNPRRGTAFDRIYGHHVERGTLDALTQQYRERTKKDAKDGTAWMVIGLIESQRGKDAAAVDAFKQADSLLTDNAIPSYYLGQSLVMIGQPEQAVEALERAIARKPIRTDLLEIFQSLGRVHQRAQRTEAALEVWTRLEEMFPDDPRVQEEIAVTLVEEGQLAAALTRYESLVKIAKDPYRKSVFQMEAADLKVKLKRFSEGVAEFETMLAGLNPDSWLYREVRRKIDEIFLRTDDQDGLAKYYEAWLGKHDRDVDAMARLSRILARQARVPEAQRWLEQALKLAPSRKELRLAFIDQLVEQQRFSDAIKQYESLDETDPNNPDYLRDWGKLILRDTSQPKQARAAAAETVWRRLTAARPDDALTATQVADLFRHASMQDLALEHYQKAVELAPDAPQYREYLGEYYHILKRPDEALSTWRAIAAGENRNVTNVARLAQVLASFGYFEKAIIEITAATKLDARDFSLQMQAARMHVQAQQYDNALTFLDDAGKLAANNEEEDSVLEERVKTFQLNGSLAERAETLAGELSRSTGARGRQYLTLARFREALRQYAAAIDAINAAIEQEPRSIPFLSAAARIQEQAGNIEAAAEMNRTLANIDRRSRSDYLTNVARLESQLGRTEQALQAGRDLIAAAPGNSGNYEFFAQLCFGLGETEEGLQALRRALRVNPTDPQLAMTLGSALADQFRTDEAIELYWQAFGRHTELDGKLPVVEKLTDLYLQTNRFDRLLERLQRERQDRDLRREMTICLAQAYNSAGDYGEARAELESLLDAETRDTQLLQQLSKLAETEGDAEAAMKYQEQLAKLAPGPETEYRLAILYNRNGRETEASSILLRLTTREQDPARLARNLDGLIASKQYEDALSVLEPKLREDDRNWELLYREGVVKVSMKADQADRSFLAILALDLPDEELTESGQRQQQRSARGTSASPAARTRAQTMSAAMMAMQSAYQVRRSIGLDQDSYDPFSGGSQQTLWTPASFGQARMAALGWLLKLAESTGQREEFLSSYRQPATAAKASKRAVWDWIYLTQLSNEADDRSQLHQVARVMAEAGDEEAQLTYVSLVAQRSQNAARPGQTDTTAPLDDDEMDFLLKCYRELRATNNSSARVLYGSPQYLFMVVSTELKRAGREEEETELYEELLGSSKSADEYGAIFSVASQRGDWQRAFDLLERWSVAAKEAAAGNSRTQLSGISYYSFLQLMGMRGAEREHADVLRLADAYLDVQVAGAKDQLARAGGRPARPSTSQRRGNVYVNVWYGSQQSSAQLDFPTPNAYLDQTAMNILRNAYEVFKRNEALPDLLAHFEQRHEQAPETDKVYSALHLSALHWWNEEKEEAGEYLMVASQAAPDDLDMRMQVVQAHISEEHFEEALELLDGLRAVDYSSLARRETQALDLAVRIGDTQRARQAAERLFGLRLGAEEQLALAAQMRRLGMSQHADAVMARASRQAGNNLGSLVTLMNQYLAQGDTEVAIQAAHRLLRRTSGSIGSFAPSPTSQQRESDSARKAAIQCLSQTGKLADLIRRAEQQVEKSPNSARLYQQLSELYEASGKRDEAMKLQGKIVELQPDNGYLRFQYAQQLERVNKRDEAMAQYVLAIKADPRVLQRDYSRVVRLFQRQKKSDELAQLFMEIDLKSIGRYYIVSNLVSSMMREKGQEEAAVKLFQKAWQAFPNERLYMLGSIANTKVWELPEIYEMVREAFLPTEAAIQQDAWVGLMGNSYSSNGTLYGPLYYTFQGISGSSDKLKRLQSEVAARVEAFPLWRGGRVLVALLEIKQGNVAAGKTALEAVLAEDAAKSMPGTSRRVIAQEIESHEALRGIAIVLYEESLNDQTSGMNEFQYTAGPKLANLYKEMGQRDKARAMFLRGAQVNVSRGYPAEYIPYQKIRNLSGVAEQMGALQFPVDALRLYREMLLIAESPDAKSSRYAASMNSYIERARRSMDQATNKISGDELAAAADQLLGPPITGNSEAVVDLMLTVSTAKGGQLQFDSMLFSFLTKEKLTDTLKTALNKRVAELTEQHPEDVSVQVAAAHHAFQTGADERSRAAVDRLVELVGATPLEDLAEGKRPTSQQRREAEPRVALWLTARECLRREEYQEAGLVIGKHALAAARRQLDRRYAQAMLQEWGTIASSIGDGDSAIALWEEMLALSTERLGAKSAVGRVAPLVQSQYDAALSVARLSARKAPEFSLKAIRSALEGGPPVPDVVPGGLTQPRTITSTATSGLDEAARQMGRIATDLEALAGDWKAADAPPELVYETLAAIVFCESRPGEILFYPQSVTQSGASAPNSVGQLLIEAASSAKRTDDLKQQIADRQANPGSQFIGDVMFAKLYTQTTGYSKAQDYLVALSEQITKQPVPSNIDLACHAAIPALGKSDEMVVAAMPIVNVAMNSLGLNLGAGTDAIQMKVARVYLRDGDSVAAKPELERYLQTRLQRYINSSADYVQDVQKRDFATVSGVAASYHQMDLAMEYLGRSIDATTTTRGEPDISIPVWHLARHVATLAPDQAYQLLFDWTIPGSGDRRETVRFAAAFNPGARVPELIVSERLRRQENVNVAIPELLHNEFGLISNFTLLIDAAEKAGKLEELTEKLRAIRQQGEFNCNHLLTLCHMAAGERIRWIEKFPELVKGDISVWRSRKQAGTVAEQAMLLRAFTFMQACLRTPKYERFGRQVAASLLDVGKWGGGGDAYITHVQYELAMADWRKVPVAQRTAAAQLGLKLWHPGTPAHYAGTNTPPAIWAAHEGHVVHATGPEHDFLYFLYPLTGEFEFSFDTYSDHFSTGDVGYGGLVCEGLPWANRSAIWPVAHHEDLQLPRAVEVFAHNRRFTVSVSENSIRYAINGHLVYEEKAPSGTSPWLHLTALHHRRTVFRNAKLTGRPVIPREVPLLRGNGLDGWDATWFNQSLPQRLTKATAAQEGHESDWWCHDGTLHSRSSATGVECQIAYHRPLLSGDVVRYEFFYEPGQIQVHPSIGDIAFVLRPDDVRLHWMGRSGGHFPYESWNRNVPAEPSHRRGPQQPPLQAGQWNDVVLSLVDETVMVQLNGELVYERPIEPANNRRFGLFHWRDETVAQVRNIVLTGDWPTELSADEIANPLMPASDDDSPAIVSARYAIVGEEFLTQTPYDVWLAARDLPPKHRYDALRDWVLPGRGHPTFRLQAAFAPIDVAPPAAKHASHSGQLVAPAMELIRVANELGKLDEVAGQIEHATPKDHFGERSQAALRALIALARDDDALASAHLLHLSQLRKQMPADTPEYQQWPEAVALAAALHKPGLARVSRELGEWLVEQQRKQPVNTKWEKTVRHLQAVARWQHDQATKATRWEAKPALTQWTPANHLTAEDRSTGIRASAWRFEPGEVEHFPGNGRDLLYFNSPLTGNFEVEFEATTHDWREIELGYDTRSFNFQWDGRAVHRAVLGRAATTVNLEEPIAEWGRWAACRLAINNGQYQLFVNGRLVAEEQLPPSPDPWLYIRSTHTRTQGRIRNVRILGEPMIPQQIELSTGTNLAGWRADYYQQTIDVKTADWRREGEVIVGRLAAQTEGSHRESLLHYHRPLLEDGELSYEFYYEAGKVAVYPALDRAAFLLGPDGVRLHWLTDAGYERTGLSGDNATALSAEQLLVKELPLLEKDWNKMKLSLTGNTATLNLNGSDVVRYELDPANQRLFGLFHYRSDTAARVRNVVYRGDWPKTLPPVERQELALNSIVEPPASPADIDVTLHASLDELAKHGIHYSGLDGGLKQTAGGALLTLPPGTKKGQVVGFEVKQALQGNFDVIVTLDAFRLLGEKSTSAQFSLTAELNDPSGPTAASLERGLFADGQRRISPTTRLHWFSDTPWLDHPQALPDSVTQLRLVRRDSRITYLVASAERPDFRIIDSFDFGTHDLNAITLFLAALDDNATAELTVKRIEVRSQGG